MNAKDQMITTRREEANEEYAQYCDWLYHQQECLAQLMEHGYIPTTKETRHAEI